MAYNFEDKEKASKAGASGSRKGVPNKTTKEIRDAYQKFVEDNVSNFQEWIERIAEKNPAKAIELISNLSDFVLPKLSRTEVKAEIQKDADLSKVSKETLDKLYDELNTPTDTEGEA